MTLDNYKTDPAYIRNQLEAGETPLYTMNLDSCIRVKVLPVLYEGSISLRVIPEYLATQINDSVAWTTEEPVDIELTGAFVESNTIG